MADQDEKLERARVMTEKGYEYSKEAKRSERNRQLKTILKDTASFTEYVESADNTKNVRKAYDKWMGLYESLLSAHEDYQRLLTVAEAREDSAFYEEKIAGLISVKRNVETLLMKPPLVDDDVSSSRSSRSSASSKISVEKIKEAQKKAELLARKEAFKERQKIEEEKLRMKMKEEELDLDTEIKISEAKEKVLDELEKSILQNETVLLNVGVPKSIKGAKSPESAYPQKSHQPEPANLGLLSVSKELNKPKAEIQKFGGNPLEFKRFIRQFNTRVNSNTDSFDERLNFLLQFTYGEAHKIVSGYSNLEAERGYKASLQEFQERYGDPNIIARAYVKKVLDWPVIKQDQAKGLDEYAVFLRECLYAVESVDAMKVLEYSENLKVIIRKMPYYMHDKWRNLVYDLRSKNKTVTFEHLVDFVRKEAKKANDPVYGKDVIGATSQPKVQRKDRKPSKSFATTVKTEEAPRLSDHGPAFLIPCMFCNGHHSLENCQNIVHVALTDRYAFLKTKGLCFGCLKTSHMKRSCRNKLSCAKCKRPHPTILHVEPRNVSGNPQGAAPGANVENISPVSATSYAAFTGAGAQALPVVPVRLKHEKSDKYIETYAFLDSGSTATFCSEKIPYLLGIEGKRTKIRLETIGESTMKELQEVRGLEICSLNGDHTVKLPPVLTQPSIPVRKEDLTSAATCVQSWPHLRNVPLQSISGEVELLIGVNVPKALEPWDVIPSENGGPFAVRTRFGWVVNGPVNVGCESTDRVTSNYISLRDSSLEEQLKKHFNQDFSERTIDDKPEYSVEDNQFMDIMKSSCVHENGHYVTDLPFKEKTEMPNNRKQAEQRLKMLSKRFSKDMTFRAKYIDFMNNVLEKGYAEKVSPEEKTASGQIWYLPHHGVSHPKKDKLRVVFDCAARYQGTSLNDQLLQGPNLTNSIVGTLTRFRQEEVAVMGDIESMFYQVHVSRKHQNFQRFLWWPDGDTSLEPQEYRMKVHLFGSTSSPSCANFALRQTANHIQGHFNEEVVNAVRRNFYVDDCLKSVRTEEEAMSFVEDLRAVLNGGGFHIAKWVSNNRKVMLSVPVSERAAEVKDLDLDSDELPVERTLGVNWRVDSDTFSFSVDVKEHPHTRRGILSTISSIYDPLGFLAPMILSAKSMLQELCQLQVSWDDPIPDKFEKRWCQWLLDITELRNFEVSRCFKPAGFGAVASSELHHFADASEKGYGMVSYLRLTNLEGRVHCSFVVGRSRVAPLKKVTIPRLELTAATVAARTDRMLREELDMHIEKSIFWTDSMSVLRYIRNTTSRFHTFVANRLTVIHEGSVPEQWRYVNTKLNPADVASRGMPVSEEQWKVGWIEAPPFLLLSEEKWPVVPKDLHGSISDDPEVKGVVVNSLVQQTSTNCIDRLIEHHSSWYRLKKSVAWIIKVIRELKCRVKSRNAVVNDSKHDSERHRVSTEDLQAAELVILAYVQKGSFANEIQDLRKGASCVKRNSSISRLDPTLSDDLLRVGGRLDRSCMPEESKHPVILPKGHHVSRLILRQVHVDLKHAGRNHMLSTLRQRYWIVNATTEIKAVISKCVDCRRQRAPVGEQKMANLPADRVTPDEPPFTRVGVDYFGPFLVKNKRSELKRYGVIFTCLASRAVHLEVAHSLDTDSYINALRRFISRRGQVSKIVSDNGTNFVGAERELCQAINEWNLTQINEAMLQRGVDWQFNPPAGSHHGGVWERLIRSVRKAMNHTLREQTLDDEGLSTLLCEVESVLNGRPLTKNSDQVNDLEALTPNHLLLQKCKPNLPPGLFVKTDSYCRRRWRQVQYLADLFWRRWVREYLPLLQERQKWREAKKNLKVGDIVLVVDATAPRNSWQMAIVTETIPDKFGYIRQVKIKTATNILTRPIDKLCVILEME